MTWGNPRSTLSTCCCPDLGQESLVFKAFLPIGSVKSFGGASGRIHASASKVRFQLLVPFLKKSLGSDSHGYKACIGKRECSKGQQILGCPDVYAAPAARYLRTKQP